VVVARYPGARRRFEDGVEYRPLGLNLGHLGSMASYHLALPFLLMRRRADLVVEDFAAPMSSALIPLWTGRPTIALVQWLAADETSRRYGLPFWWFEEVGMRLHTRFVAVSESIAERLRRANPEARVDVVYGGVEIPDGLDEIVAASRRPAEGSRPTLLYLGRIEIQPKGLDVLLDVAERLKGVPFRLVIAGDGPHASQLRALISDRDLSDRVEMIGRVGGAAKWELLARADAVAMPSRYESFGLVAAEAAAVGTPVVAWDLPSLREILPPALARLVTPFDVDAFYREVRAALEVTDGVRWKAGSGGTSQAIRERFDWDNAALLQESAYLDALSSRDGRWRAIRRFVALVRAWPAIRFQSGR
jgi:glycosyltransferase involved in cell wall biosynthesis